MSTNLAPAPARKRRGAWKFVALLAAIPALPVAAQTAAETPEPAASPASEIDMYVFPKNKQDAEQQMKDETECYDAAEKQTGFDPKTPPPSGPTAKQQQEAAERAVANAPQQKGRRLGGAARGAAVGAVGGAIVGSPGAGAGVGAVAGTVAGGQRQRRANEEAQRQAAANATSQQKKAASRAKAAYDEKMNNFQRAFTACMDARGYSVK